MDGNVATFQTFLDAALKKQKSFFEQGNTLSYNSRYKLLIKLQEAILANEGEINQALKKDLNKGDFESYTTEVGFVLSEIKHTLKSLKKWMKPQKVATPMVHWPAKSFINKRPFGNVLVIGPWNYPFQLVFAPLVGAIAAGNTAVLKPSELAPETSKIISKLVKANFPEEVVLVVEGGIDETTALLDKKFDYIFYTGSTQVGRIIAEKAAKHLTPTTLELGGKSPCLVFGPIDLDVAAKRIAWGKFMNAGQTCVAPDYVLVEPSLYQPLLDKLNSTIKAFYGDNPQSSPDYAKIINQRHFLRLKGYLNGEGKPKVLSGGKLDEQNLYVEPTLIEANPNAPVMRDEIFGPILPILKMDSFQEAIKFVQQRPRPLAAYLFSNSDTYKTSFLNQIISGGACINDTVIHLTNAELPFGGVGESGLGFYHGKHSFNTFSHHQSVMKRSFLFDIAIKYPPYIGKLKLVRWLLYYLG